MQGQGSYLDKNKVPERVDVPEIPQAKERGEKAAEQHSGCKVVTEGEPLPKNATAEERVGSMVVYATCALRLSTSYLSAPPTQSH